MTTDWEALAFVAAMAAPAVVGCVVVSRRADRRMDLLKHRFAVDPQCGEPVGTGVERTPAAPGRVQVPAALPWSPLAPVAEDPRPSATGPNLPAGLRRPQHPAAPAGVQRRRVILHG